MDCRPSQSNPVMPSWPATIVRGRARRAPRSDATVPSKSDPVQTRSASRSGWRRRGSVHWLVVARVVQIAVADHNTGLHRLTIACLKYARRSMFSRVLGGSSSSHRHPAAPFPHSPRPP